MEIASVHTKNLIEMLLNVYALTNMHRASGHDGHKRAAAEWLPRIESELRMLAEELRSKPTPAA